MQEGPRFKKCVGITHAAPCPSAADPKTTSPNFPADPMCHIPALAWHLPTCNTVCQYPFLSMDLINVCTSTTTMLNLSQGCPKQRDSANESSCLNARTLNGTFQLRRRRLNQKEQHRRERQTGSRIEDEVRRHRPVGVVDTTRRAAHT
jgi:hypothetical protein